MYNIHNSQRFFKNQPESYSSIGSIMAKDNGIILQAQQQGELITDTIISGQSIALVAVNPEKSPETMMQLAHGTLQTTLSHYDKANICCSILATPDSEIAINEIKLSYKTQLNFQIDIRVQTFLSQLRTNPQTVKYCIGTIPRMTQYFIGRNEEFQRLRINLNQKIVFIVGESGIGKTQLLVKYLHEHKKDYNIIIWLKSAVTLIAHEFKIAARQLGIEQSDLTVDELVRKFYAQLQLVPKVLLYFDGATEALYMKPYLPQKNRFATSHIDCIISSQSSDWLETFESTLIQLKRFNEQESKDYFYAALTGYFKFTATPQQLTPRIQHTLTELITELGGLPRILAKSIRYMTKVFYTIENVVTVIECYLTLYKKNASQLLASEDSALLEEEEMSFNYS